MTSPAGPTTLDEAICQARTVDVQRRAFFRALHPGQGFRDMRSIRPDGRVTVSSHDAADFDALDAFAKAQGTAANLFFGVAVRASAAGRKIEDCSELHSLYADFDFKDSSEADIRARLATFPFEPSATIFSGGGLHVYWFLREPLDLRKPNDVWMAGLLLKALATLLHADIKSAEPARILRMPGTLNRKYSPAREVVFETLNEHLRYEIDALADVLPWREGDKAQPKAEKKAAGNVIQEGSRNDELFQEGCRLRHHGHEEPVILAMLIAYNQHSCKPPLSQREVETIATSCAKYQPAVDTFPLTEAGDAEFFATVNAHTARYDHRRGRWLLWDGNIWVPQTNGEIARLALAAVRGRQRAAIGDKDRMRWAIGGESRKRLTNMLALAQNHEHVADAGDSWDVDPWLLGAPNCIIDLKTGTARPGRPEDRITKRVRTVFDPSAECPAWDKALLEIFEGDCDLISYMDRYLGYSLTGDCREESLSVCHGNGANGKSLVLNTIAHTLGDYADDLPFSAFEMNSRAGIPNDIAKLVGMRFVTAAESGEAVRLNEARVKALTGRDPITARFLHQEFFTFQPVAKFWLSTNHKPEIRDDSEGFWRRLHLIPFNASFIGREDRTLKDRLRGELPGILARAVRGCLAWQKEGLNPPAVVREATQSYRSTSLPLTRFIDECCVLKTEARTAFGSLFTAYVKWCGAAREKRLGRHEFSQALHDQFEVDPNEARNVVFVGIALIDFSTSEPSEGPPNGM